MNPRFLVLLVASSALACPGSSSVEPASGQRPPAVATSRTVTVPAPPGTPEPAPARVDPPAATAPRTASEPAVAPMPPATPPVATAPLAGAPATPPAAPFAPSLPASPSGAQGAAGPQVLPPPTVEDARQVLEGMRALAAAGNPSSLLPYVPKKDRGFLLRPAADILATISGRVLGGVVQGGRVVLQLEPAPDPKAAGPAAKPPEPSAKPAARAAAKKAGRGADAGTATTPPKYRYAVFLRRPMGFRYDPVASQNWAPPDPGPADPMNRDVSLAEAVADLPGKGRLVAEIDTSEGLLTCGLLPDKAPRAVATFVGLARGKRAFLDPSSKTWVRRPYYDGQTVHRTSPGAWFSFGCPERGSCPGVGFSVPDEPDLSVRHDLPGRLGLDNGDRPNGGAARLYVTATPDPDRDDRSTILGQCGPLDVIERITRTDAHDARPGEILVIRRVTIHREEPASP